MTKAILKKTFHYYIILSRTHTHTEQYGYRMAVNNEQVSFLCQTADLAIFFNKISWSGRLHITHRRVTVISTSN